jgi:hypothetical protein
MKKLDNDDTVLGLAAAVTSRSCELITDGWTKGKMTGGTGGAAEFCIHGAINLAMEEIFGSQKTQVQQSVEDIAVAFICDEAFGKMHSRSGGIPAAAFNDAAARKHQEVLGVLGRAADRLWDLALGEETVSDYTPSQWCETEVDAEEAKQYLYASLN